MGICFSAFARNWQFLSHLPMGGLWYAHFADTDGVVDDLLGFVFFTARHGMELAYCSI